MFSSAMSVQISIVYQYASSLSDISTWSRCTRSCPNFFNCELAFDRISCFAPLVRGICLEEAPCVSYVFCAESRRPRILGEESVASYFARLSGLPRVSNACWTARNFSVKAASSDSGKPNDLSGWNSSQSAFFAAFMTDGSAVRDTSRVSQWVRLDILDCVWFWIRSAIIDFYLQVF